MRRMATANPLWGAARIHGELIKLGIEVSERTVSRCIPNGRKPPPQSWRTLLENHLGELAAIDFFTVPTARFQILFCFLVLSHERRRVLHFNLTHHPTAEWTARQIVEAFPWDSAPRYLIRDRDGSYGLRFRRQAADLGITEVLIAPRSPWQNAYLERLIGSIRRDCLDHVIILSETHLRRILASYLDYYHHSRTHLSLHKDTPEPRPTQTPDEGEIVEVPEVSGLHHRFERRVA